jgi:hypothetical protein
MPKNKSKLDPHDDHRGYNGLGGWWISFKEAKERCCGNEAWWTHKGYQGLEITPAHYAADKPVWLFENGDMYLGQWRHSRQHGWPVEHGLGITYNNYPVKCRGLVCIGEWRKGHIHGMAKSFWLESSRTWRKNEFPASAVRQEEGNKTISRPFIYVGPYNMSYRSGRAAIVTLKDGTQRKGPWQEHAPVGDWWTDHRLSKASSSTITSSQGSSTSVARRPRNVQDDAGSDSDSDPDGQVRKSKRRKHDAHMSFGASKVGDRKRPPADPPADGMRGLSHPEHNNSEEVEPHDVQQQDMNHCKGSAPISPDINGGRKRAARPSVVTSTHRNEGLESAAMRNRRRLLDERLVSQARNAEIEDSDTSQNVDAAGPTQINTSVEDRDEDGRVFEISRWLMVDVIGFDYDNNDEAESYARHIIAFGAHSVHMIIACLTSSDVEGFEWMKPLHRRRLSEKLREH